MVMNKILLLGVLACWPLFASGQIFSDPAFKDEVYQGLDLMYEMRYDAAAAHFERVRARHPDHPAPYFMLALNRWWQTYVSITTSKYYDYIEDQLELALDKNDLLRRKAGYEQEQVFFEFMSHALAARLAAYRGEWFSAVNAARKVIDPMKVGLGYAGQVPEFDMVAGLYHYYVATYHELNPVIRPFLSFFPAGDKAQGLRELEAAAARRSLVQAESAYFLGTIYLDEIRQYDQGLRSTLQLWNRYPRNVWFKQEYARALVKSGQPQQGEALVDQLIGAFEAQPGHRERHISSLQSIYTTHLMIGVYHYKALARMYGHRRYDEALGLLARSDDMARLAGEEVNPYRCGNEVYRGICYDNLNRRSEALAAYKRAGSMDGAAMYQSLIDEGLRRAVLIR
ncbi:MAG: hypothetical protein OHK0039_48470 [Bacteroidia bacterium]